MVILNYPRSTTDQQLSMHLRFDENEVEVRMCLSLFDFSLTGIFIYILVFVALKFPEHVTQSENTSTSYF